MNKLAQATGHAPIDARLHQPATLGGMLADSVRASPDREAVVCQDQRATYLALGARVADLGRQVAAQSARGEIVAVLAPNSVDCVVAAFAVMATGARVAPVNPFYARDQIARLFAGGRPRLILCVPATRETADALASDLGGVPVLQMESETPVVTHGPDDVADALVALGAGLTADDPALLIFTGGTTGVSKAVEHTHRALIQSVRQHCTVWELQYDRERFLNVAPLFHIWAFGFAMLAPVYLRSTLVLIPRYEPEAVLDAFGAEGITVFAGGPAPIYHGLLHCEAFASTDFTTLQIALTGGAACPQAIKQAWRDGSGALLLEGWGMSEGAPLCLNWRQDTARPLSVGRPVPETTLQIVDVETGDRVLGVGEIGEVRARGPQLMSGYRLEVGAPDPAMRDGWLHTGDIGRMDEDGFLYLIDRKKEIVIVGGYNVYPRHVEDELRRHPTVRDAAVVGAPDDYLGETPVAFVVGRSTDTDTAALHAHCRDNLVKYMRPTQIILVDALPRTGANKIDKKQLRQRLAQMQND